MKDIVDEVHLQFVHSISPRPHYQQNKTGDKLKATDPMGAPECQMQC